MKRICMFCAAALVAGTAFCTPPPQQTVVQAPAAPPVTVDPLALDKPDTDIVFTPVAAPAVAAAGDDELIVVHVDHEAWEEEQRRSRSLAEDAEGRLGYRIQLYTSTLLDSALAMQDSVRSRFNTDVYLEHDAPYYKLRIGDFMEHAEADRILSRVSGYGYKEAWIVRSEICHPCREKRMDGDFVLPDSVTAAEEAPAGEDGE